MNKHDFPFDEFDAPDEQSIDFGKYLKLILRYWKTVLIWACVGAVIGIAYAASTPKEYSTKAIVAPEITTRTGSGGLSSLASLAGINMNSMALTDAMHPDLYPVIVKSTSFLTGMFEMPVEFRDRKGNLVQTDLYDYVVHYEKRPWWGKVMAFPHIVFDWIKGWFKQDEDPDDAEGYAQMNPYKLTKQQEMVVKSLSGRIEASVDRKTFVMSLKVKMQDRDITANLANAIIEHLKDFVTEYRLERAQTNVDYCRSLFEAAKREYLSSQKIYANYVDSHLGMVQKSVQVEQQHLQNVANLKYQVYNQSAQNLANAEAKLQLESPVLVVVQPGIAPHKGSPSKVKSALSFFVLGAFAAFVWIIIKKKDEQTN